MAALRRRGFAFLRLRPTLRRRVGSVVDLLQPWRWAAAGAEATTADDGTSLAIRLKVAARACEAHLPGGSRTHTLDCFGNEALLAELGPLAFLVPPSSDSAAGDTGSAKSSVPQVLSACPQTLRHALVRLAWGLEQVAEGLFRPRHRQRSKAVARVQPLAVFRGWNHEMLVNLYVAGTPRLYPHCDLAALSLLVVPSSGGGALNVHHCGNARPVVFPGSASRISRRSRRNVAHRALLLPGTRFQDAAPLLPPLAATTHSVGPSSRAAAKEAGAAPRLSIVFFFCRGHESDPR